MAEETALAEGRPKTAEGVETEGTRTDGALDDPMPISDEDLEAADDEPRRSRASLPPPLPPQARRTSVVPSAPPPAGRDSVPPKAPPSAQSGTWRISERASPLPPRERILTPPPLPPPRPRQDGIELAAMRRELGEARGMIARLRLQVRQRDDRIAELQRELGGHARKMEQATEDAAAARAELERARDELRRAQEQAAEPGDDLKRLPGVGPGFERALRAEGITSFAQIAAWSIADVHAIAPRLRTKPGRILRDQWIDHARALVGGASNPDLDARAGATTDRTPVEGQPSHE